MAVETNGTMQMRGEPRPGTPVGIRIEDDRLRIRAGAEVVGDWDLREVGIKALQDGFQVRVEGEEFHLRVADEVAVAEAMGLAAASPRMARKVAAAHNPAIPDESVPVSAAEPDNTNVVAIAFALGGVLVLAGGIFLGIAAEPAAGVTRSGSAHDAGRFWAAFVVGGALMVLVAYLMSIRNRWARLGALGVLTVLIVLFAVMLGQAGPDTSHIAAYGFIAGGVVVGVAVLFSGSLSSTE